MNSTDAHRRPRRSPAGTGWLTLATLFAFTGCEATDTTRPVMPLALGAPLDAGLGEPLLLTVAAPRPRTEYLVDEGYSLAVRDGTLAFVTDTAGTLGVVFEVDGARILGVSDFASAPRVDYTTSDGLVVRIGLTPEVDAEVRFVAATSRSASLEVVVHADARHRVRATAFLLDCAGAREMTPSPLGIRSTHAVDVDPLLAAVGQGTFATDFVDGLDAETAPITRTGVAFCDTDLRTMLNTMLDTPTLPPGPASLVGITLAADVTPDRPRPFRFVRGTIDAPRASELDGELARVAALEPAALLAEGSARLEAGPVPAAATREQALVMHASYALLEQSLMPAEGTLAHDYFLFGREPTWWFGRLGMHIHEGLALIAVARYAPTTAIEVLRNFVERTASDGYAPYNFGPVIEQTVLRTASAPLFSYVAREVLLLHPDPAFLRDAYDTGVRMHAFWDRERDADADGLAEWGGAYVTETLRDLDNVIWSEVTEPQRVEAVDLNAMLVADSRALAWMATELGLPTEAAAHTADADARAARMEAVMWDEASGFYYHVEETTETFTVNTAGDLLRQEIAGFLPLWAGVPGPARRDRLLAKLADPASFGRPYGVPGLSAADSSYETRSARCCMWDGPTWVPWNYLIARGLEDAGRSDLATELTERTRLAVTEQLVRTHQFREHYSPDDPGLANDSMPNYVWSALVADMMLRYPP